MYRIKIVAVLLFCLQLVNFCYMQSCPADCTCINKVANCTNLNNLPSEDEFPADTEEFIFNSCTFENLPKITYTSATKLIIWNSNVENISASAFSDLEHLIQLDLTGNPLVKLDPEAFIGLGVLKELVLVKTGLQLFPAGIAPGMTALEKLDLSSNMGIEFDPRAFHHTSLTHLSLNNCSLSEPPVLAGSNLNSVTQLDLNRNKLEVLGDGSFWTYEGLHKLYLDNSGIESVHENAFEGLTDLAELYMGINSIKSLDDDVFEHSTKLKKLDLRQNKLETLEYDVTEGLELEYMDLSGNPWKCDCTIEWIAEAPQSSSTDVLCATPEEFAGKGVVNVTSNLDCPCGYGGCDEKGNYIALAVGIPIIIICVGLIGFFIYKIVQTRRARHSEKNVRYSAVYRDTTETAADKHRPTSEL